MYILARCRQCNQLRENKIIVMIFIQKWGSNDIHLVNLVSGHIVKDVLNLGHGFFYYKNINIGHICHYPIISCDTLVNTLTFFEFSYAYYIDLCLILLVAENHYKQKPLPLPHRLRYNGNGFCLFEQKVGVENIVEYHILL